jgi:hypothetical protein
MDFSFLAATRSFDRCDLDSTVIIASKTRLATAGFGKGVGGGCHRSVPWTVRMHSFRVFDPL